MSKLAAVALLMLALIGCENARAVDPCKNPPPNTACAVITPSVPITTECPGPADDQGNLGCDSNTEDGCICGARLDSGNPAGSCHAGVCVLVDGGVQ